MSTAPNVTAFRARQSRRAAIEAFFLEHLGEHFDSLGLHARFGTSFRACVSEINHAPASPMKILNAISAGSDAQGQPCERSVYWAELRAADQPESETAPRHSWENPFSEERLAEDWYIRQTGKPRPSGEPEQESGDLPLFAGAVRP